jgi:hypothetical protein
MVTAEKLNCTYFDIVTKLSSAFLSRQPELLPAEHILTYLLQ